VPDEFPNSLLQIGVFFQVTILVSSVQKIKPTKGITHAVYKVPYTEGFIEKMLVLNVIKGGIIKQLLSNSNTTMPSVQRTFCEALLNDTKLLNPLKKFDVIITDTSIFCSPLIVDYLDIMRIEYCPFSPRFLSPFTPYESVLTLSYVPMTMSHNPGKMTFLQRTKNTLIFIAGQFLFRFVLIRPFEQLKQKYNIKPQITFMESMDNKELTLFLADFALEYSYPIPPGRNTSQLILSTRTSFSLPELYIRIQFN
jgi:hypothetical protein